MLTRPSVATVLSPRPWEATLAIAARHSATVRLVGRVYEPMDLQRLPTPDWVVVGAETAWLTAEWVASTQAAGTAVLGVFAHGEEAQALESMGVDAVADQRLDPFAILDRLAVPPARTDATDQTVVAVLGPRGAGTTTVAIALADGPDTAIVDTDDVPGVGPGLGMAPPGTLSLSGRDVPGTETADGPAVLTIGGEAQPAAIVTAAAGHYERVVVDAAARFHPRVAWCATEIVLVVDASVQGMLRAIALVDEWDWPRPRLVLNRTTDPAGAAEAARASLGLEPWACIPLSTAPLGAARLELAPHSSGRLAAG